MNLTDIIRAQKKELEIKIGRTYVPREALSVAQKNLDSALIKVITGPRRSGKSVFCLELLNNKNFAYLNFDDKKLEGVDEDEVIPILEKIYPEAKYFLFDEIQNLPKWELFANKLARRDYNLILTGSNARLLSQELATHLTGRFTEIKILTFSYREFVAAGGGTIHDYLVTGGFPEIVMGHNDPDNYLATLIDSVIYNDVIKRYSVRFSSQIYNLATYLGTNFASEISFTKLKNVAGFKSVHTVQNYLAYLEEAYLFIILNRFDFKFKEQMKAPKKVYLPDTGMTKTLTFSVSQNLGRLAENVVFLELIRRGFVPNKTLFSYKTKNNKEVDFICRQGFDSFELIQVCYDLITEKTKEREMSALDSAKKELNCRNSLIITDDNLEDWLLGK